MTSRLVSTIFRRSDLDNAMLTDPVSKFRVSQPETLIDTDFEYGLQSTKWETIELVNNIPIFFAREGDTPVPLIDVTVTPNTDIVQVTTQTPAGFITGAPFIIKGLSSPSAEGSFVVLRTSLIDPLTFYYKARSVQTLSGSIYDTYSTVMYLGRLYQSTLYTSDAIVNILTDGGIPDGNGNGSTLTVTTKYPHGFRVDSKFILANSMGTRQINFDASLIDPTNTVESSNIVPYTNSNNSLFTGFRSRNVIPYDYESKKTLTFIPSSITANTINIPTHGQYDSTFGSNLYLYNIPRGDEPITGLVPNQMYALKKIDNNYIGLNHVSPTYIPGLWNFSYTLNNALYTNFTSNLSMQNDIFLKNPTIATPTTFTGTNIWTGFGTHSLASGSVSGGSPDATAVGLSNLMTWKTAQSLKANLFFGYFKPLYSGISNIEIRCLDYAKLWFGEDANWVNGVSKHPSAQVPFLPSHPAAGIRTSLSVGTVGIVTYTIPYQVIANQLYPIRIVNATSNLIPNVGVFPVVGINTYSVLSMRIKENSQTFGAFGPLYGNTIGNHNLSNLFVCPIIGNGPLAGAPRRPLVINTTTIPLETGTGTIQYGEHTLQKTYPIVNLTQTNSVFTTTMNTTNYLDANIPQSGQITYVAAPYSSNIPQFTRDIFASGHTTTIGFGHTSYIENLRPSYSNVSTTDYLKMNAEGRSGTLTVGIGSYTNTTDIRIVNGTSGNAVALKTGVNFNVSAILPVNTFTQYDSFYVPNHGYLENDIVTLTLLDNSKSLPVSTATVGESAILDGSSYKINRVDGDFFRLKTLTAGTLIDIKTTGNAPIKFTTTKQNPNKDTIYAPVHNLGTGLAVTYYSSNQIAITGLVSGNTYYVNNATTNLFTLSSNINNLSASTVDFTTKGEGTHYFQTADKDTDGNYTITSTPTASSFKLTSPNYIPPRVLPFFPPSTVNLATYSFNIQNHRLSTGALISYSNFSTNIESSNIAGLTHTDYYAIRIDTKNFKIASSYEYALSNSPVPLYNYGEGSNHIFNVYSLQGEVPIINSINLSNVYNYAYSLSNYSPNIDFLQLLKKGDTFTAELQGIEEVDYFAASNDAATFAITFFHSTSNGPYIAPLNNTITASYNLNVGEMLQYQRYGIGATSYNVGFIGLSNNYNYYVRPDGSTSTRFFLYPTSNDALQDLNRVRIFQPISGVTTHYGARFVKKVPNTMFESRIEYINSSYQLTLSNNPYYNSSTNANFITKTYLFPKADGYAFHRSFDGGVEMIPTTNPDTKFIRQTRRYFRYQSGKGMQCSKAINFNAANDVQSLTRNYNGIGNCALIETRFPHRINVGAYVKIEGAVDDELTINYWNSSNDVDYFYIPEVPSLTSFIFYYPLTRTPTNTIAAGFPRYTVRNWSQSTISAGMFDDQNGLFFQYDGVDLYAVRRNSTRQLPGFGSVVFNSSRVEGNINSRFTTVLQDGTLPQDNGVSSYIVIKGCTYKVSHLESDTIIYIQPPYRGKTNTNVTISIVRDEKVPQSEWNVDKCDGTGPTGYLLDITKIQMIYIDYAWYGAGKARFGLKGANGEVRYMHEFLHNNSFNEAYLRSGNLPGRYEIANQGNPTYTPALMHWGTSIIMDGRFDDDKAYLFTIGSKTFSYYGSSKYIALGTNADSFSRSKDPIINRNAGPYYNPVTGKNEYAYRIYSSSSTAGGTSQGITGYAAGTTISAITYESVAALQGLRAGSTLVGISTAAPAVSSNIFGDWTATFNKNGSFIAGTFANKSAASTVLNTTYISSSLIYVNTNYSFRSKVEAAVIGNPEIDYDSPNGFVPLVSLRLSPSVDNGLASLTGVREIINRMQLTLAEIGVLTTHDVEIQLRLNTYPSTYNWINATSPSLCQYLTHDKGDSVYGGTPIYSFRAQGGPLVQQSGSYFGKTTNSSVFTLEELATLGNSIIGGDNVYPDGPDILTIGFVLLDTTYITQLTPFICTARISWKESQA